jgi:hypothetical protein
MPVYSFGQESPVKFRISHALADNYNAATEKFYKAQQRFNQKFGRRWDPLKDPVDLRWNRREKKAWNEFAGVLHQHTAAWGPMHYNDITDDFLVLNGVSVAVSQFRYTGRGLGIAVAIGVVYGLLRRR